MKYISTRGGDEATFGEAVIKGLAADGGLFVPETLPDLAPYLSQWRGLPYAELAFRFLSLFADDIPDDELRLCINLAYGAFPSSDNPAPTVKLNDNLYVMELFHGPTLAFKDFALQLLGRLYERYMRNTGRRVNVLGATSGDTGSAAVAGIPPQSRAHCFILYPEGGVAELQERQIACTGSPFVHPVAVCGSFDDAQGIVKRIFGDAEFASAHSLVAVNSINIARILAQCVYYLDAALKLDADAGNPLEFIVPTGNFGNILAGQMLSLAGVRGLRFCAATNVNDVVARFFKTGEYRPGKAVPSLAPSMDIQRASNFERWLWQYFGGNAGKVAETMTALNRDGHFSLPDFPAAAGNIRASVCSDEEIRTVVEQIQRQTGYTVDPHTACAFAALNGDIRSDIRRMIVATAHPAKFPDTICGATGLLPRHPRLEELKDRPVVKDTLPADLKTIKSFIAAHCSPA
jgi:threonine synthase